MEKRKGKKEAEEGQLPLWLTLLWKVIARDSAVCEDAQTMTKLLMEVCREEFAKAKKVFVDSYQTMREIDARTMEILVALLQRPK